jgi:hypothetical protein
MGDLVTIPSRQRLEEAASVTPTHMHPNTLPSAVVLKEALSPEECDAILDSYRDVDPYSFAGCGAMTREKSSPLSAALKPLTEVTEGLNGLFWEFLLDHSPTAWLQTYEAGGKYALHTDATPGQSRKLTAVLMLSDHTNYVGGSLEMRIEPRSYSVSRTRGTVVVFPAWMPHEVTPITRGVRQTINLGYWGPTFK